MPRIMVLPDTGVSVTLLPVAGKEIILEKLGFYIENRNSTQTALKPSADFDLSGLVDSLQNAEIRPASSLIHIKVRQPDLSLLSGSNTLIKAKTDILQPADYTLPPYAAYFLREDLDPLTEWIPVIPLDEIVAEDGTVFMENVYDFVSGHSLVVVTVRYEGIETMSFIEKNVGKSDPFTLMSNRTHYPEILHFEEPFSVNAHLEKLSENERYVVWDSIPVAEYYTIHEIADGDYTSTPTQKIFNPRWRVINIDSQEIVIDINAVVGCKMAIKTRAAYVYRPQENTFEKKKY